MTSSMPAASISRARRLNSAMCVLQIGQSTKRRNCRWTRRFASGRFMASPVTASITVVGSMSPGLNFMAFLLVLAIRRPTAGCGNLGHGFEILDHANDILGEHSAERAAGIDGIQDLAVRRQQETRRLKMARSIVG